MAVGLRHTEILTARFQIFDLVRRRPRVKVKAGKWRNQPLTRGAAEIRRREPEMAEDQDGKSPDTLAQKLQTPPSAYADASAFALPGSGAASTSLAPHRDRLASHVILAAPETTLRRGLPPTLKVRRTLLRLTTFEWLATRSSKSEEWCPGPPTPRLWRTYSKLQISNAAMFRRSFSEGGWCPRPDSNQHILTDNRF